MENLLGEWSVCFSETTEGVEGHVRAGCAHPGPQLSDTDWATVNVFDCWLPEINAVISSWTRGVR